MNKQDGDTLVKVLEEYVNIEINAGNRLTKCNGSFILNDVYNRMNRLVINDINKEKLWEEYGEEWLEKRKNEDRKNKKNIDSKNIINANKTISSKLLDEELKKSDKNKNKE